MLRHVPLENLDQRTRLTGRSGHQLIRLDRFGDGDELARDIGLTEPVEQVANRLGFADHLGRHSHAESALEAQDQLGAAEAVDAKIAVEAARQRHVHRRAALAAQLAHEILHDRDQRALARCSPVTCRGSFSDILGHVHHPTLPGLLRSDA
jgi:hypothetical protein